MKWFLDVLRGMVIGLANVIPGVSGGTMMVSMGIYDKLIYSINNLFEVMCWNICGHTDRNTFSSVNK